MLAGHIRPCVRFAVDYDDSVTGSADKFTGHCSLASISAPGRSCGPGAGTMRSRSRCRGGCRRIPGFFPAVFLALCLHLTMYQGSSPASVIPNPHLYSTTVYPRSHPFIDCRYPIFPINRQIRRDDGRKILSDPRVKYLEGFVDSIVG